MVNRLGTPPNARSSLSTSRGRQTHAGLPSNVTAKIASSYGGMGGGGTRVAGSVSVSQLLESMKSNLRAGSTANDDQTFPHAVDVRSKLQPGRVAKKSSGRPSWAALWYPSKRRTLSEESGRQVRCVSRSRYQSSRPSLALIP